jgi:hypothetical protein
MMSQMTGHTTDHGAFNAAFRVRRAGRTDKSKRDNHTRHN